MVADAANDKIYPVQSSLVPWPIAYRLRVRLRVLKSCGGQAPLLESWQDSLEYSCRGGFACRGGAYRGKTMEASLVAFAEVEAMLLKLRRQAAKLLRSKTEAEVVQQLQDALNVLQGVHSFSEKSAGPSYDETHYVSMSEKRGVKKRRLACAAGSKRFHLTIFHVYPL